MVSGLVETFASRTIASALASTVVIIPNELINGGLYDLGLNGNIRISLSDIQKGQVCGIIFAGNISSINDQVVTSSVKVDGVVGGRNAIGGKIGSYNLGKSSGFFIGCRPAAHGFDNICGGCGTGKGISKSGITLQCSQKSSAIYTSAPFDIGNLALIVVLFGNGGGKNLVGIEAVTSDVSSLGAFYCKRRDGHGANHSNCQQCSHEFFHCFFHGKSPFLFCPLPPPAFCTGGGERCGLCSD